MTTKIYYSSAVRGPNGNNTQLIKDQISILQKYGDVLTKHMASDNVDLNLSDSDICQLDDDWLSQADIMIADVTNPSLGVGFMINSALSLNKPVVCFVKTGTRLSAMINGRKNITVKNYDDLQSFETQVKQLLTAAQPLKVFLFGPPGAGKSTIANKLASKFNLDNISTGSMMRDFVNNNNSQLAVTIKNFMDSGQLIPKTIMKDIVINRLKQCLNQNQDQDQDQN
jgi:2'-deoxynucleoside 5'-phosphate N-hydrolase